MVVATVAVVVVVVEAEARAMSPPQAAPAAAAVAGWIPETMVVAAAAVLWPAVLEAASARTAPVALFLAASFFIPGTCLQPVNPCRHPTLQAGLNPLLLQRPWYTITRFIMVAHAWLVAHPAL